MKFFLNACYSKFLKCIFKNVFLANGSKAMSFWPNPGSVSRVQRKYYFFNVDNPDQVQSGTAKPRLTQKGPYCFNGLLIFNNNN